MTTFDYCVHGRHDDCVRSFRRFTLDPKTRQVVWSDTWLTCQCPKRGCKCYVPKSERKK